MAVYGILSGETHAHITYDGRYHYIIQWVHERLSIGEEVID